MLFKWLNYIGKFVMFLNTKVKKYKIFQVKISSRAHVRGIDLATNMVAIANERAIMKNIKNVEFAVEDMTKSDYPPNSFDIIYSRCGSNRDF